AAVLPDVPASAGVAERLPLRDGSLDAVVVAQGFHWFDGEAALAEVHRTLRPGGGLGLVWNVRDATVSWVGGLDRIFDRHEGDVMRFWRGEWRKPFLSTASFTPLERADFRHEQPTSHEGVVERVLSVSFIAALDAAERERVTNEVRAMLRADPLTKDRDEFLFPYITQVYTCRRIP
ncbi:MAG: methyltransferase domain-containing protein, partial [Actinomycetota bacterium]